MKNSNYGGSRSRKSIVAPILALIIASLIVLVTVTGIITYYQTYTSSVEVLTFENRALSNTINGWINVNLAIAENCRTLVNTPGVDNELMREFFTEVDAQNPELSLVYAAFPDESLILSIDWTPPPELIPTQRPWYRDAAARPGQVIFTPPYVDNNAGGLSFTAASTINMSNANAGVVAIDIPMTVLVNYINKANETSQEYKSFLLDSDGSILVHPDPEFKPNDDETFQNIREVDKGTYAKMFDEIQQNGFSNQHGYLNLSSRLDATGWYIVTMVPNSYVIGHALSMVGILVAISIVILAISIPVLLFLNKTLIKNPLSRIASCAELMAKGDIEKLETSPTDSKEISLIILSLNKVIETSRQVAEIADKIAKGDYTCTFEARSQGDMLGRSLCLMIEHMNNVFGEIRELSKMLLMGSQQIAGGAQSLSQGSNQQVLSIEELSGSIAEVAAQTKTNAQMAEKTASLSDEIKANAQKGNRQMSEMMSAVDDINAASQNIKKVIKVIDDIAFQTNILALNAAVEAARAGQHGKGFAVVAEEVRNLAAKSAEAAKETGDMIQNSMDKAELGSRIASETAESFNEISEGIKKSSELIEEIAKSSKDQSVGILQINSGIDQVAQVVQQASATAQQSAAASESMNAESQTLQELISKFKIKS